MARPSPAGASLVQKGRATGRCMSATLEPLCQKAKCSLGFPTARPLTFTNHTKAQASQQSTCCKKVPTQEPKTNSSQSQQEKARASRTLRSPTPSLPSTVGFSPRRTGQLQRHERHLEENARSTCVPKLEGTNKVIGPHNMQRLSCLPKTIMMRTTDTVTGRVITGQ